MENGYYCCNADLFAEWVGASIVDLKFADDTEDPLNALLVASRSVPVDLSLKHDSGSLMLFRVVGADPESRASMPMPCIAKMKYSIVVADCMPVASSESLVMLRETDKHHQLDIGFLALNAGRFFKSLFSVAVSSLRTTVTHLVSQKTPQLFLEDSKYDRYVLPPVVGQSSSSSAQLRPERPSSLVKDSLLQLALTELNDFGAGAKAVPFSRLVGVSSSVVGQLDAAGAVSSDFDEFGELQITINSESVRLDSLAVVGRPVEAFRLSVDLNCLKLPKFYLIARLSEDGWWHCCPEQLTSLKIDGPRCCDFDIHRPVAYFAAFFRASLSLPKMLVRFATTCLMAIIDV